MSKLTNKMLAKEDHSFRILDEDGRVISTRESMFMVSAHKGLIFEFAIPTTYPIDDFEIIEVNGGIEEGRYQIGDIILKDSSEVFNYVKAYTMKL